MNQHNVQLLDLPNEILLTVLENLDNIDVLYSLLGINNQRLDILAQEQIFTNRLDFVSISQSNDEISSISPSRLNRFCIDILPRIHENVKSLILESGTMECILRAGNYPNLTELKLYNINKEICSRYFMNDSLLEHIDKQQIADLTVIINETSIKTKEYTLDVCVPILVFFKSLHHLTIIHPSMKNCSLFSSYKIQLVDNSPRFSLCDLPPMTFSSSTLTKLCIRVSHISDVGALLDGRLEQLTTFIVQVQIINDHTPISHNRDALAKLRCFSLICYGCTNPDGYDNLVIPLLRQMSYLEELTLYLRVVKRSTFIDGIDLENGILIHIPQLHSFTFYVVSENVVTNSVIHLSSSDIQRTFTNPKYGEVVCVIDYFHPADRTCRVFSLPFQFYLLERITNNIPNIVFHSVTHLTLIDKDPFKHEFFVRLARAFPSLQNLCIWNIQAPFWKYDEMYLQKKDWCSIVEYPHLISLDIAGTNPYYVEHFLNERKTRLPRLTQLHICYNTLKMVTKNFTRAETRRNCSQVKQLSCIYPEVFPKHLYDYFSSL